MNRNKQHGVTFLELLIVVVIIGILAAIAYPSYTRYVADTKRTAATSILLQIADRQQQSFMDNKTYSADLVDLGFPANPLVVGDDGRPLTSSDTQSVYSVALSNVGFDRARRPEIVHNAPVNQSHGRTHGRGCACPTPSIKSE